MGEVEKGTWRELANEYRKSGKTAKQWCAEHGKNINTLKSWISKLKKEQEQLRKGEAAKQQWQEIGSSNGGKIEDKLISPSVMEMQIGKFRVIIGPNIQPALLKEVCEVLMQLC